MLHKLFVAIFLLFLVSGCFPAETFELGEAFELNYLETKSCNTDDLNITFKRVANDSRCPINARCITAGNAEVLFAVSTAGQSDTFALNTNFDPTAIELNGYVIELLDLSPSPEAGKTIYPRQYAATVVITKAAME